MTIAKNATVAYTISVIKFSLTTAPMTPIMTPKHAKSLTKLTNPKDFFRIICTYREKAIPLHSILKRAA